MVLYKRLEVEITFSFTRSRHIIAFRLELGSTISNSDSSCLPKDVTVIKTGNLKLTFTITKYRVIARLLFKKTSGRCHSP
jgi:hypothetical protein